MSKDLKSLEREMATELDDGYYVVGDKVFIVSCGFFEEVYTQTPSKGFYLVNGCLYEVESEHSSFTAVEAKIIC